MKHFTQEDLYISENRLELIRQFARIYNCYYQHTNDTYMH